MGIQINGQNDEISAVDGSGIVRLDVEGNITGNLVGDVTANQITVGNSFLKSNQVGLGQTDDTGRNAGINTATGALIYNTSSAILQVYDGNKWVSVNEPIEISATGGDVQEYTENGVSYKAHIFNSTQPFNILSVPSDPYNNTFEYLLVAGGGGGGGTSPGPGANGGGGGAGGLLAGVGVTAYVKKLYYYRWWWWKWWYGSRSWFSGKSRCKFINSSTRNDNDNCCWWWIWWCR